MPPKPKITREQVIDAAFAIARREGIASVNARTAARQLGCSTQPVMYHFPRIEDLKRAVYSRADRFHTEYLMSSADPLLGTGLNYIRFAVEEPHLFQFLFQSGYALESSLPEMIDSPELQPILAAMGNAAGMDMPQMKEVFLTIALFTHGYASIIANNGLDYDETTAAEHLERAYRGAVLAAQEERT